MDGLTDDERAVLDFEAIGWRSPDLKAQAVFDGWGISLTRHEQVVQHIIDLPAALAEYPVLVKRLRRLRETRQQARRSA